MSEPGKRDWLTIQAAADLVNVSAMTIRRLVKDHAADQTKVRRESDSPNAPWLIHIAFLAESYKDRLPEPDKPVADTLTIQRISEEHNRLIYQYEARINDLQAQIEYLRAMLAEKDKQIEQGQSIALNGQRILAETIDKGRAWWKFWSKSDAKP